jgi:hypothetical protein
VLAVVVLLLRRSARSAREELRRSLETESAELECNARLIGVQSRGAGQMRGTGSLALTGRELVFLMWVPRRELRISREAIESVETGHGLAGKRTGAELLHVRWRETDTSDEAAWQVKDPDDWIAALRS